MKILFFLEPLIEMGRPYWKESWAQVYRNIIQTLEKSSAEFEYCIAFNEPISQKFQHMENVRELIFTQEELLNLQDENYLDLTTSWYKGTYTEEQLNRYVELVKSKFGDFSPEVIFTLTQIPYVKKAFPEALVLHMELGLFSRSPYPISYQLDPCGIYQNASLVTYKTQLEQYKINNLQHEQLEIFKANIQGLISEKCPFKTIMAYERSRFEYLLLVPLQLSGTYAFDALCNFKSQYDFLVYVLNNVPQHIGVIATTHPEYDVLDPETVQYLSSKYPHFIYHHDFTKYTSISQYLIAYVDAVVTIGSSVGLQTLLWDKKLIELGSSHLDCIADAHSLNNLLEILAAPNKNKSAITHWLITKYAILEKYVFDPVWLSSYIFRMHKTFSTKQIGFDCFQLIDNEERLFRELGLRLDKNIPYLSATLPMHELRQLAIRYGLAPYNYQARMYINGGEDFFDRQVFVKNVEGYETFFEYEFCESEINQLTFIPLNAKVCLSLHEIIVVDDLNNAYQVTNWNTNAFLNFNKTYVFTTDTPSIIINTSDIKNIRKVIIKLQYKEIGFNLEKCLPNYFHHYQTALTHFFRRINNNKIVVFGTGSGSMKVYEYIPLAIAYFVDNNSEKWGCDFFGAQVRNPLQLQQEAKEKLTIIVASQYYSEISKQLIALGFEENIHFWNGCKMFGCNIHTGCL